MNHRPRLLITLGDVAGIGPEVVVKAWADLNAICTPVVVGDVAWLRRSLRFSNQMIQVVPVESIESAVPGPLEIPCLQATTQDLSNVTVGKVSAIAGQAAFDFLCVAIDLTRTGKADAIVTMPLNKEGLHAAGLHYPGHTEILAEKTGVKEFGMMLYAPASPPLKNAIGVVHVTLHMALRDVFDHLSTDAVLEKIYLIHGVMARLGDETPHPRPLSRGERGEGPRLAVAALNPHAGDGGIFGDEENRIIAPAVERAKKAGINVVGPLPSDTLFVQAQHGKFDGIVAMYHDQGHIALKLLTGLAAVNVTLGLPIVRTSVAHGTAYDIAGNGVANPDSLLAAALVAARLASRAP